MAEQSNEKEHLRWDRVFDEINVFNFGADESRPPPDLDFDFVPEPEKKCCQIL